MKKIIRRIAPRGFTLIELLAVIVILAIIILIVMPIIINIMDSVRRASLEATARGLVKTAEQDYMLKWVQGESSPGDRTIKFFDNEMIIGRIDFSGKVPNQGEITIHDDGDVTLVIHDRKYCAQKYPGDITVYITEQSYMDCIAGTGGGESGVGDLINQGYIPIATAEELNNIRYPVEDTFGSGTEWEGIYLAGLDKKYVQVEHVDLESYLSSKPNGWTPLGTREHCDDNNGDNEDVFSGIYNGAEFTISNLSISSDGYSGGIGLFGTANNAIFENINISGANVIRVDGGGRVPLAILVGFVMDKGVEIKNVNVSGDILTMLSHASAGGGIIGGMIDVEKVTLTNVIYQGNLIIEGGSVGGIIGLARRYEELIVHNVHFVGNATTVSGSMIGGIIGEASAKPATYGDPRIPARKLHVTASSANGTILLDNVRYSRIGGIIGTADTIDELRLNELDFNGNVIGTSAKTGGIVGWLTEINSGIISDINVIGNVSGEQFRVTSKIGGVIGALNFYENILIENVYRQGDTLSETWNKVGGIIGEATYATTIGYSDMDRANIPYRTAQSLIMRNITVEGNIIGQFNKIGGLVGNLAHTDYVEFDNIVFEGNINNIDDEGGSIGGLIGRIHNAETLIVKNSNIKTDIVFNGSSRIFNDVAGFIGRIAGVMDIDFDDVHYEGNVMKEGFVGGGSVGGLIGRITAGGNKSWWVWPGYEYLDGVDYFLNINNSSVNASLNGTGSRIGGFVGFVDEDESRASEFPGVVTYVAIDNSYFKGEINFKNDSGRNRRRYMQIGGFVGDSKDTVIRNSYVIADINASIISGDAILCNGGRIIGESTDHNISGMVGQVRDRAVYENVYFAGSIKIDKDGVPEAIENYNGVRPITTFPSLSTVTSSYYDISLLNISDNLASGKTSSEMSNQGTYLNWNFTNIWKLESCINDSYPYLQWQSLSLGAINFCILGSNSPVEEEETLTVQVHVLNQTSSSQTKSVSLTIAGSQKDNKSVTIPANSGVTVSLNWVTEIGDGGIKTAVVNVDGETATTLVEVLTGEVSYNWTFAGEGNYAGHWTSSHDLSEDRVWVRIQQSIFSGSVQRLFQWANANTVRSVRCVQSGTCPETLSYGGQIYQIQQVGSQCWMAENLNYDEHTAGISICYGENSSNCSNYGRLYSLEAAKEVCPVGWNLPSDNDWKTLEASLGMPAGCSCTDCDCAENPGSGDGWLDDEGPRWGGSVGDKLRSSTWDGNNSSGLNFLPGGYGYWEIAD